MNICRFHIGYRPATPRAIIVSILPPAATSRPPTTSQSSIFDNKRRGRNPKRSPKLKNYVLFLYACSELWSASAGTIIAVVISSTRRSVSYPSHRASVSFFFRDDYYYFACCCIRKDPEKTHRPRVPRARFYHYCHLSNAKM